MRSNKRGAALKKLWRELVSVSKNLRGMATDSFKISSFGLKVYIVILQRGRRLGVELS